MQITSITKNGKNVTIYIDGEFWADIPYQVVCDFGLQKGMQVTDAFLQDMTQKADEKNAFDYSLWYLSRYSATTKKMSGKLYEKGYKKLVVDNVISKLCDIKYLDDYAYAQLFAQTKSKKLGANRLKAELRRCGVATDIIDEVVGALEKNDIFESALQVAKKWYRSHELETYDDSQKFFRFMAYRGFDYDIINRCREVLKFGEDD